MELGRRKKERSTPVAARLSVWLLFSIVVAFIYLDRHPILIETEPIPFKPYEIRRDISSDVVVVVDYDAIRESGETFGTVDFSAAWIDTFEQEIGPISVATPSTLNEEMLSTCRLLVLTHSATKEVPTVLVDLIRSRVRNGMFLVMERPEGELRRVFSADGSATPQQSTSVTFSTELAQPFTTHLENVPFNTSYVTSRSAAERSSTRLAFDGAPVVYTTRHGEGFAMTVEFDYSRWLVGLQQGTPNDDFTISADGNPKASDLVANKKMEGADIPYADLVERFLVWGAISADIPIAAYWPFRNNAQTTVILIRDDAEIGPKSEWLDEFEKEYDATSTYLPSYNVFEGDEKVSRKETGFLWRMSNQNEFERLGVAGFEPLKRPIGLASQYDRVRSGTKGPITTSMIEGGAWGETWDGPFRELASINVRVDTGYVLPDTNGFSFGTGFPFLLMSSTGVPIGFRELPIVVNHETKRGPRVEQILEMASQGYHVPISYRMSANWFASRPDPKAFKSWERTLERLQTEGIPVVGVRQYDTFLRERRASGIRSKVTEKAPIPWKPRGPSEEPRGEPLETGTLFRVTSNAKTRGMSIMVPEEFQGKRIVTVREKSAKVEGERVANELESQTVYLIGIPIRLIAVPSGFSTVDVFYQ